MHQMWGAPSAENRLRCTISPCVTVSSGPGLLIDPGVKPQPTDADPYSVKSAPLTGEGTRSEMLARKRAAARPTITPGRERRPQSTASVSIGAVAEGGRYLMIRPFFSGIGKHKGGSAFHAADG